MKACTVMFHLPHDRSDDFVAALVAEIAEICPGVREIGRARARGSVKLLASLFAGGNGRLFEKAPGGLLLETIVPWDAGVCVVALGAVADTVEAEVTMATHEVVSRKWPARRGAGAVAPSLAEVDHWLMVAGMLLEQVAPGNPVAVAHETVPQELQEVVALLGGTIGHSNWIKHRAAKAVREGNGKSRAWAAAKDALAAMLEDAKRETLEARQALAKIERAAAADLHEIAEALGALVAETGLDFDLTEASVPRLAEAARAAERQVARLKIEVEALATFVPPAHRATPRNLAEELRGMAAEIADLTEDVRVGDVRDLALWRLLRDEDPPEGFEDSLVTLVRDLVKPS